MPESGTSGGNVGDVVSPFAGLVGVAVALGVPEPVGVGVIVGVAVGLDPPAPAGVVGVVVGVVVGLSGGVVGVAVGIEDIVYVPVLCGISKVSSPVLFCVITVKALSKLMVTGFTDGTVLALNVSVTKSVVPVEVKPPVLVFIQARSIKIELPCCCDDGCTGQLQLPVANNSGLICEF